MKKYEFHDVANIFPLMTESEFSALVNDIKENGLREPIWLFNNKIIDGRNRYRACIEAKVEPKFKVYDGAESRLVDFVISLNLHRRHLSTGQKACFAVLMLPSIESETQKRQIEKIKAVKSGIAEKSAPERSSNVASQLFGVSVGSIYKAKKIKDCSESLFNDVRDGKTTLQKAEKSIKDNSHVTILKRGDSLPQTNVTLTKRDLQRVSELTKELGVTEQKATDYVKRQKAKRQTTAKRPEQSQNTMFKFQLPQDTKNELQSIAKRSGKSIAELLRESIHTLYNV